MKGRIIKTVCITNATGGSVVQWNPPCACAIVEVALCVSGCSATAGLDSAGGYLTTQADSSAVPGDNASENILAYVPALALVNGTAVNNSVRARVYREVRPGGAVWLRNDAFASGGLVCVAILTFVQL